MASALAPLVQALGKEPQPEDARETARRVELRAFAAHLGTPAASALAEALIRSQDEHVSLVKTLET